MSKAKPSYKPGDAIYVPVEREHINDSDPCNKENCMLTRGVVAWLMANYGEGNYKVKSTNHGVIFEIKGRRYVAVFDTKTAFRIYNYDQTFRKTHSKEKARTGVRPFKARIMIESSVAATRWPRMSDETKKKLREYPKRRQRGEYLAKAHSVRRELSL